MRSVWLIVALVACDAGVPPPPRYELSGNSLQPEFVTDHEPTRSDFAFFLSLGYRRPQLVAVTLDRSEVPRELTQTLREWKETYDGIPVRNDVKSVQLGRWNTRFRVRLHEPDLPDRKRLLPQDVARSRANLGSTASGRLAYEPRFVQRKVPDTASDYVLVIDHYDLVYEFDGPDELVHVDAYAGTVERFSHWVD